MLVAAGLLIGFFLGAVIIYVFNSRPAEYHLTDAALERIARLFQQHQQESSASPSGSLGQPVATTGTGAGTNTPAGSATGTGAAIQTPGEESTSLSLPALQDSTELDTLPVDTLGHRIATEGAATDITLAESASDKTVSHQFSQEPGTDTPRQHSQGVLEEEIRVRRDRLLGTIGFTLPAASPAGSWSESTRTLDSLLRGRTGQPHRSILVEFWESPLNFTGYKMSKNSLILYGLDQIESVSLQMHEEVIYLKYYDFYFPLKLTSEFLPLSAVEDPLLINKLEQRWP